MGVAVERIIDDDARESMQDLERLATVIPGFSKASIAPKPGGAVLRGMLQGKSWEITRNGNGSGNYVIRRAIPTGIRFPERFEGVVSARYNTPAPEILTAAVNAYIHGAAERVTQTSISAHIHNARVPMHYWDYAGAGRHSETEHR